MFSGKSILVGVCGGIAAYKSAMLVSALVKAGADVDVVMTRNATQFVAPLTFATLTGHKVPVDTFERVASYDVEHISLAQKADLCVVAPATANVIAKMAHGIADDMLTTTLLATRCPKLVAPAMDTGMWDNPATRENIEKLRSWGVAFAEPGSGRLACGTLGKGRMAQPEEILDAMEPLLTCQDIKGVGVLITAGPTQESLDPVRYLTNHSTGKMGYELARAARNRGAVVTLVSGPSNLTPPHGVELVQVQSAAQMFEVVSSRAYEQDIIIKAAAVADYTPVAASKEKIKKSGSALTLELSRTTDILAWLGDHKTPKQVLVGFAMETQNLLQNAKGKLERKHADMIVANSLRTQGAGFGGDTNVVTMLTQDGTEELPLMSKYDTACRVLDEALKIRKKKQSL